MALVIQRQHDAVREHDTALALSQIGQNTVVPNSFTEGRFTTVIWGNNDFGEKKTACPITRSH